MKERADMIEPEQPSNLIDDILDTDASGANDEQGHTIDGAQVSAASPLYQALGAILGKVTRLEKTERNNHGNYDFAPADTFRDFIRPLFHEHGLWLFVNEAYSPFIGEVTKQKTLKFTYEFVIMHIETGETTPTIRRSVFLPYVGSQTAGIASTFALKEWLKNQFLISTGEPDPEGKMGKDDEAAKNRLPEAESKAALDTLKTKFNEMAKDATVADLHAWWTANMNSLNALNDAHFQELHGMAERAEAKAKKIDPDQMTDADLDARAEQDK